MAPPLTEKEQIRLMLLQKVAARRATPPPSIASDVPLHASGKQTETTRSPGAATWDREPPTREVDKWRYVPPCVVPGRSQSGSTGRVPDRAPGGNGFETGRVRYAVPGKRKSEGTRRGRCGGQIKARAESDWR